MTLSPHTFRVRLTLWYSLALSVVLAVFFVSLYLLVRIQLLQHHDRELLERAAALHALLGRSPVASGLTPEQLAELSTRPKVVLFRSAGGDARVLYRSKDVESEPRLRELSGAPVPPEGRDGFRTYEEPRGYVRVLTSSAPSRAGGRDVVRVMERMGDVNEPLKMLRLALALLAPLAVLCSSFVGYLVAGRAAGRVDEITTLAREIEASRLGQRLPVPAAHDEIGRLVETFNDMIGRLEASFDAMKRFTADASHELRSPLANIQATIEAALFRSRSAEEYRAALASADEDVSRLRAIVEDLLILARADSGRISLDREPVRLDVIAREVVESFRERAAEMGIEVRARAPEPATVSGDERWLRQLAFNLVDNAVKFAGFGSTRGSGSVDVAVATESGAALLTVSDTGPGIPPEALGRVFERFFRADRSRSRSAQDGFGLGLSIASWVVDAHRGTIRAENVPGGGARFRVTIPLERDE